MFFANVNMIKKSIKKISPNLVGSCDLVFQRSSFNKFRDEFSFDFELFQKIPSNSIDFEVIEKSNNIKAVMLDCEWSDVGTWDSISKVKQN